MTTLEQAWYTRGRVDQLERRTFPNLEKVSRASHGMYIAGAESVTTDEQDLYAETVAEIREYESFIAWHVFSTDVQIDLAEARRRLLALREPMPVLVVVKEVAYA